MIRNVSVTSALNIYRSMLQFALNIALAHFLLPADFGEIAFVLPVTLFILLLGDFGITAAIVRGSADPESAGAAATLCIVGGLGLGAVVAVLYAVGGFTRWPGQTPQLLLAFGLVAVIAVSAIVPRAMLERSLAYSRVAIVETVANTTAFAAAVTAAMMGAGVWSFAIYHLTMQALRGVLFWHGARSSIRVNLRWRLATPLMAFGGWVVAFNLVNYFARNLDNYIVGGLLGTAPLGVYALAYQIMLLPLMALTWPASGVLLSTLSRLRDDPSLQRRSFLAMLGLAATVTFPMMAFVALRGGPLFSLLLPARWHDVGPVIGRMAIAGGLQSSTAFVGALFLVQGRVRQQFWVGVAATALVLTTVAVAAWQGRTLERVADAYVAATLVLSACYYAVMARLLDTRLGTVLAALAPGVVLAAICAGAMLVAEQALAPGAAPALRAALDVAAYGATALALLALRRAPLIAALATLRAAGVRAAG